MASNPNPPLDEHGGPRNRMVIQLDEFEGHRYLDVRSWYLNKKDQEWRRTKKGVTLNKDRYRVLRGVFETRHEEIMEWIGQDYVPEEVTRYEEAQETARVAARYEPLQLSTATYDERRDPQFFDVTHEGGAATVRFNLAHPAAKTLAELPAEAQELVASMLLSFDRARRTLDDAPAFDARTLLGHLVQDWGKFLKDAVGQ